MAESGAEAPLDESTLKTDLAAEEATAADTLDSDQPTKLGAAKASSGRLGTAWRQRRTERCWLPMLAALALSATNAQQLPANTVNVSSSETCPAGTTQPTVDWCRWYAGELGVYFLDKSGFYIEEGALVSCGAPY